MPDIDDLIHTLADLREVLDRRPPLFAQHATGLEVTQAVQYYHAAEHLTDPNDRGKDNAVPLVAYKPAIVRAYVAPPLLETTGTPVGGTLRVERRVSVIGPWKEVVTLAPWLAPTVTPVDDGYDAERRSLWQSLNFRIPAQQFAGYMRLTVTLDDGATRQTTVAAYLVQTLRVRVIRVGYQGPSTANPAPGTTPRALTLAAPTLADAQTTAGLAFRMMPVQQTGSFASAGSLSWTRPLDDARSAPGACSTNWDALLTALGTARDNDGNRADVVYYGLLPGAIPLNVPGCGIGGLGSAAVGDTATFVHEIGHGYGFAHTPSGNAGATDPAYPTYEPYMSASIGEYGTDIQTGTVFSPASSTDYMSYGPNRWMSLYQHQRLIQHDRLAPTWIHDPNPFEKVPVLFDPTYRWWPNPPWNPEEIEKYAVNPMISIRGVIDEEGVVRVDSVARVAATATMQGPRISWSAQLMGGAGGVAAGVVMTRELQHGGDGCGCAPGPLEGNPDELPLRFHAMVPDVEAGSALRIVDRRGDEAWVRRAPGEPVRFAGMSAEIAERSTLQLRWDLTAESTPDVWAQYSADGGETWRGLSVGLADGAADLDLADLPSGPVLVRLLGHDGFATAASEPVELDVPARAPWPAIVYPADGETVAAEVDIEVVGSAVDHGGDPIDDDRLVWELDGEPFARGRIATVRASEGEHTLTLRTLTRPEGVAEVRFHAGRSARDRR